MKNGEKITNPIRGIHKKKIFYFSKIYQLGVCINNELRNECKKEDNFEEFEKWFI